MMAYPEHDKLEALITSGERDAVQQFLDWLLDEYRDPPFVVKDAPASGRIILYAIRGPGQYGYEQYPDQVFTRCQRIMAAYFGIDEKKLVAEKEAMLGAFRSAQEAS